MTTPIELLPVGNASTPGMRTVTWADPGSDPPGDIIATTGPWFTSFGNVSDAAVGVGRLAVGVFIADRATHRNPLKQRRNIALHVWVPDPAAVAPAVGNFEAMLGFLTGDEWHLTLATDLTRRPNALGAPRSADQVSLLSGGLDSCCGALIRGAANRIFLSHSDSSVITNSQNRTIEALFDLDAIVEPVRLSVSSAHNREPSRRSRSFLFMGLAIALADAVGAQSVEVPENGFTSLNPPLAANRNGVLTTRSTHPWTFATLQQALVAAGISIQLLNPYEWMTKGELVEAAVQATSIDTVQAGLTATMSCAKSNPILYNSGFGRNCGLDYSCIVRRGAVLAAGILDTTDYLCMDAAVDQSELEKLRRADVSAVRLALQRPPSLEALLSGCGPFPAGYDFDAALDLWQRGHDELRLVPLP